MLESVIANTTEERTSEIATLSRFIVKEKLLMEMINWLIQIKKKKKTNNVVFHSWIFKYTFYIIKKKNSEEYFSFPEFFHTPCNFSVCPIICHDSIFKADFRLADHFLFLPIQFGSFLGNGSIFHVLGCKPNNQTSQLTDTNVTSYFFKKHFWAVRGASSPNDEF